MATAMFYGFMIEILINGYMFSDLMNLVEVEINDVYAQVFPGFLATVSNPGGSAVNLVVSYCR